MEINQEKPVFLRNDEVAAAHHPVVNVFVHSIYKPSEAELKIIQADYSNIWSHLNQLYASNDVEEGKEYYTEGWFRQICAFYKNIQKPVLKRTDLRHQLHISTWASDALVCTAIDSNVIFKYQYPNKPEKYTLANIAVVLLVQGDHWRIDGIRIIDEIPFCNYN